MNNGTQLERTLYIRLSISYYLACWNMFLTNSFIKNDYFTFSTFELMGNKLREYGLIRIMIGYDQVAGNLRFQ